MSSDFIHLLDGIATWLGILGLIPVSLFVYYYATEPIPGRRFLRRYSKGWRTFLASKLLMYMMLTWIAFIIFVAFRYFLPAQYPFEYLRIGVYIALTAIFWGMFYALRKVQKVGQAAVEARDGEPAVHHVRKVRFGRKREDS
jgi:hypothetical protein